MSQEEGSGNEKSFHKPSPRKTTINDARTIRPLNTGISAVHVSAAREMVNMHTRDRAPPRSTAPPPPPKEKFTIAPSKDTFASTSTATVSSSCNSSSSTFTSSVSIPAKSHQGECTNPQCHHCGLVIIPAPKSSFPFQDKPSITINNWSIFTIKKPILNLPELDHLNDTRFEFPLPEMIFGNSHVKLKNEKTGAVIEFNALDALDSLEPSSNLKVSYHKEWLSSRRSSKGHNCEALDKSEKASKENSTKDLKKLTDLESINPYDWTYSTNYKGGCSNMKFYPSEEKIPIDKLLKPDPILFFDESILFEDELGDNGISMLSTKIRVMPTCLLLLCRLFLRIDNVIFRVRDTRIYIDLETDLVLREYKEQECPYDDLLKKISNKTTNDPKRLLRDTNWVSQNIPTLKVETESNTPVEV